jgi:Protein of unknown function (DUF3152)
MRALLLGILLAVLLAPVPAWAREPLGNLVPPTVGTEPVYGERIVVEPGTWTAEPVDYAYQWLRDGAPIDGATRRAYRPTLDDIDHPLAVVVTATDAAGNQGTVTTAPTAPTSHRIETRGRVAASVREFARQAAQTYADPRGWRNAGVAFERVRGPSDFSLVLAEAAWLPRFSPACSVQWSCRAGRYVVINQVRWKYASPSWNGAGKSLRDYRHLVVNHETGHWLGHGHRGCPGAGRLAPVMMQQSKGLFGCRHNPWPLPGELWFR